MQGFSSRQCMGVTSLPASRHLPVCISRVWNFPATLWPPWKGGGWEEVLPPHRLAHSTRQRLPWADVLPFPSRGEPVARCREPWRKGRASQPWGPLFPCPHGLRGQGSRVCGGGLGSWSSGPVRACAYCPVGAGVLPAGACASAVCLPSFAHHSWNCSIAPT